MLWQVGNERATALYLASLPETYRPPGRKAEEAKRKGKRDLYKIFVKEMQHPKMTNTPLKMLGSHWWPWED